jgi:hypothetical protein
MEARPGHINEVGTPDAVQALSKRFCYDAYISHVSKEPCSCPEVVIMQEVGLGTGY